jgi:AcrR family transcriptional regulator
VDAVRAARTSSRRHQLLDAAVKVMSKTQFHQMSMQDLAREAQRLVFMRQSSVV